MTETGLTTPIAQPAEPIEYGTRSSPRIGPPLIVPLLGVVSLAVAVMTIALCAWSATRAYYTAPPRTSPSAVWTPTVARSTRRVTLEEGNAIVDGIDKVVPLSQKQRDMLTKILVSAEDHVAVEVGVQPTADK